MDISKATRRVCRMRTGAREQVLQRSVRLKEAKKVDWESRPPSDYEPKSLSPGLEQPWRPHMGLGEVNDEWRPVSHRQWQTAQDGAVDANLWHGMGRGAELEAARPVDAVWKSRSCTRAIPLDQGSEACPETAWNGSVEVIIAPAEIERADIRQIQGADRADRRELVLLHEGDRARAPAYEILFHSRDSAGCSHRD